MVETNNERIGMKKSLAYILILACSLGFVLNSQAGPKKREPSRSEVKNILKKIGEKHYPEDMRISQVGMLRMDSEDTDTAYYWIYCGTIRDGGYNVIIFNNVPEYLGFYNTQYNPCEVGDDYITFDMADADLGYPDPITDRSGYYSVRLDEKGPPKRITLNGPVNFVPAPTEAETEKKEAKKSSTKDDSSSDKMEPDYRSWKIKVGTKFIEVESAIFVEYKDGKVTIKDGKTGRTVTKPVTDFSDEDKEYLKELLK